MDTIINTPSKASFLSKKRATMRSELIQLSPIEEKGWAKYVNVVEIIKDEELFPKGEAQVLDCFRRSARDKKYLELVKETIRKCKIVSEAKEVLEMGLVAVIPVEIQEAFDEAKKLLESTGCRLNILRSIPALNRLYNEMAIQLHGGISNNRLVMLYASKSTEVRTGMRAFSESLRSSTSAPVASSTTTARPPAKNYLEDPQYHYDVMVRILRCLNPNARILYEPSWTERSLRQKNCKLQDENKELKDENEELKYEIRELKEGIRPQSHHDESDNNRRYDKNSLGEWDSEDGTNRNNHRRHSSRDEWDSKDGTKRDNYRRHSSRDEWDSKDGTKRDNYRRRSREEMDWGGAGKCDNSRRHSRDEWDSEDRTNWDNYRRSSSRDEWDSESGAKRDNHCRHSRDEWDLKSGALLDNHRRRSHDERDWDIADKERRRYY